ncbi:Oidioi.mRNA.OKI2018_I69.PAR.g9644.t2.cds [Oikopleura dioica]|uniref:Oidioi.mRNA.OKI2018_I69.PAR.g9644.t2.cds n=1 Tax=Oikopleura dioica TaxID=34765 RepID=A0ABN7RU73_OIKDI|nr:Oidioi.mRNA.OKI2018_I69.PAR.g9644.t2.cds [Oikopleura dioica]
MDQKGKETEVKPEIIDEEVESQYNFGPVLGRGAFGVVTRASKDGTEFAIKTLKCVRLQQRKDAEREIAILQQLDHKNVCRLTAARKSGRNIFMIMELCTGGELFDKVAQDHLLKETTVTEYLRQICQALSYLHSKNILHLDLKPENVVMARPDCDTIKIIDFGGAQFFTKGKAVRTMFGTREYMAPETLSFEPVELTTDMWSVGVLAYNLLSGLSPFAGDDDNETECNIQNCEWDFDEEEFDKVSDEAKDFISNLLVFGTNDRLNADRALEHPWLKTIKRIEEGPEQKFERSLSVSLIDNLKALIARRRWKRAGTAISLLGRISGSLTTPPAGISSLKSTPDPPHKADIITEDEKENHKENISEKTQLINDDKRLSANQNSNNNTRIPAIEKKEEKKENLMSNIAQDIFSSMKFKPPQEDQARKISSESFESSESGISIDHDSKSSDHIKPLADPLSKAKAPERKDSGKE